MNNYSFYKEIFINASSDVMPAAMSSAIQAGLQDQRVGMVVGGLSLATAGVGSIRASGIFQTVRSWFSPAQSIADSEENPGVQKKTCGLGLALVGIAGTCVGVAAVTMGVFQLTLGSFSDENEQNPSLSFVNKTHESEKPSNSLSEFPDVKYNYFFEAGSHTKLSPILGARWRDSLEIFRLKKEDPESFQVLKDLEAIIYHNDTKTGSNFRHIILHSPDADLRSDSRIMFNNRLDVMEKSEAIRLANELFSRFLDKYRFYGVNEANSVKILSKAECEEFSLEGGVNSVQQIPREDGKSHFSFVKVIVCEGGLDRPDYFIPQGLAAIHELMHLEEANPDGTFLADSELLTVTTDLINADSIYKIIHSNNDNPNDEIDYGKFIPVINPAALGSDHCKIPLGRFINFYRNLAERKGSLAKAYTSKESIKFLTSCSD